MSIRLKPILIDRFLFNTFHSIGCILLMFPSMLLRPIADAQTQNPKGSKEVDKKLATQHSIQRASSQGQI